MAPLYTEQSSNTWNRRSSSNCEDVNVCLNLCVKLMVSTNLFLTTDSRVLVGLKNSEGLVEIILPYSGVKTEENRKGRILAGLSDIWRVLLEILPLLKSNEKR